MDFNEDWGIFCKLPENVLSDRSWNRKMNGFDLKVLNYHLAQAMIDFSIEEWSGSFHHLLLSLVCDTVEDSMNSFYYLLVSTSVQPNNAL